MTERPVVFLMMARLLREKGIFEYVEAARKVKAQFPNTRFVVAGRRDERNPGVVPAEVMEEWQGEGVINWVGELTDVRGAIEDADVVVLPSYYREGIPRSLLEGSAMGKPVITSDGVGCRDVVDHRVTGLVVPVKDAEALAAAMCELVQDPALREKMGRAGREKVVREFDDAIVLSRYMDVYKPYSRRQVPSKVESVSNEANSSR
jgi:glycosyltransferase involved in cell wall biosynthesis